MSAAAFASSAITKGAPARQPRARSPARPAPLGRWRRLRGLQEEAASAPPVAEPARWEQVQESPGSVSLLNCRADTGLTTQNRARTAIWSIDILGLLVSYRPLAREPWRPSPGADISSNWVIAGLSHLQAHGLELPDRSRPRADTRVPLGLGALAVGGSRKIHVS